MLVVIVALGSAVAYAVAMVLQQRSARSVAASESLRPGLVVQLLQRRVWLLGMACNAVAFGLRGAALAEGSMAIVQPVVLTGLFFALLLETQLDRRPFTARETLGSVALIGGLAMFVLSADPQGGIDRPPTMDWLVLASVVGGAALLTVAWASRLSGDLRAAWLAGGGALLLALTAALTKLVASELADDGLALFRSYSVYALALVGGLAVLVTQSAFQAGPLRASLPVLSVVEPLASIAIGAWVFDEQVATSVLARAGELSGFALLATGILMLTADPRAQTPVPLPTPRSVA